MSKVKQKALKDRRASKPKTPNLAGNRRHMGLLASNSLFTCLKALLGTGPAREYKSSALLRLQRRIERQTKTPRNNRGGWQKGHFGQKSQGKKRPASGKPTPTKENNWQRN